MAPADSAVARLRLHPMSVADLVAGGRHYDAVRGSGASRRGDGLR
ncbi:hypothetical protein Pd630_LPD09147 (plasmid) [Rhodococcus opacus PD630]|nr:hypothetical protein Pd630_LPD09147 [Rhodococcus opacus PD630]